MKATGHIILLLLIPVYCIAGFHSPSYAEEEYHTIQAASFLDLPEAEKNFAELADTLADKQKDNLRIELISGYYTLRLGKFDRYSAAKPLLTEVKKTYNNAYVLRAYLKPERIVKIVDTRQNLLQTEEPIVFEPPVKIIEAEPADLGKDHPASTLHNEETLQEPEDKPISQKAEEEVAQQQEEPEVVPQLQQQEKQVPEKAEEESKSSLAENSKGLNPAYALILLLVLCLIAAIAWKLKFPSGNRLLYFLYACIAILGLAIVYLWFTQDNKPPASEIRTTAVRVGDIQDIIFELGMIEPLKKVEVKSKIGGEIIELKAKGSDTVHRGDVLAVLDAKELKNILKTSEKELEVAIAEYEKMQRGPRQGEIKKAEYNYLEAQAELQNQKSLLEKNKQLYDQKYISRQEFDELMTLYDMSEAKHNAALESWKLLQDGFRKEDILMAKTRVEEKKLLLDYNTERLKDSVLKAPINGVVLEMFAEEGEIVSAGTMGSKEGTLIMIIADMSRLIVRSNINEVNINKIKVGHPVTITTDAAPSSSYQGRVTGISRTGKKEKDIVTYEVLVQIDTPDSFLRPGMTAKLNIVAIHKKNVLLIPVNAIFSEQGQEYVNVIGKESIRKQNISTGASDKLHIEIVSGLEKGELVQLQ